MSKWQVKKFCDDFFSPDHTEWVAWPEGGWTECQAFPTHAEALAYADKQARTITVTLPRVGETVIIPSQHDAKDEPPLLVRFTNRMTWIYQHSDDYNEFIVLDVDHLEPLALALLAHAERMEE